MIIQAISYVWSSFADMQFALSMTNEWCLKISFVCVSKNHLRKDGTFTTYETTTYRTVFVSSYINEKAENSSNHVKNVEIERRIEISI